ncbi:MAG: hypothetical protein ACK54K_13770, partial [Gemmatimonadaceae bacterium]
MGRFDATSALALAERALQQSGEFGLLAALAFYFLRPQLNFGVMSHRPPTQADRSVHSSMKWY